MYLQTSNIRRTRSLVKMSQYDTAEDMSCQEGGVEEGGGGGVAEDMSQEGGVENGAGEYPEVEVRSMADMWRCLVAGGCLELSRYDH